MSTDRRTGEVEVAPLAGLRIAVTRPRGQAEELCRRLDELGAEPLVAPTVRIVGPPDPAPLQRAAESVGSYDWVVFTSVNGVERFWAASERVPAVLGGPDRPRVAAIGPATAAALEDRGVAPDVVPDEYVAEAVAAALTGQGRLDGARVLLPRAGGARSVLPDRLDAAGARVDEVVAYVSTADPDGIAVLREALAAGDVDMVTFTASSTVRYFVESDGATLGRARVAAIGPVTAGTARSLGLNVDVEASEYTMDGLVDAIVEYYAPERDA